ncbi:metallophosphoesterase [Propionispora hippei]|uniref:Calcineurin-like phosphoesterase domain-containing protein n=1 Tax=Propionispora hippei DSM 15287 TaxID=1123003 RepID=A0A1M6NCL8_9FIRM|nr:metallophosphoesterase [Propionispora hippei]SHJ93427.1 hypothetical protein SAMN02745170_03734 [Propionispora hippei DSM 15287]
MSRVHAIGDLHLSGFPPSKPMSIFGDNWTDHWEKIKQSWYEKVAEQDTVLLAGDTSWAKTFEAALVDLSAVDELPGRKIIIKGNHDYWWLTSSKMQRLLPPTISFIHNSYVAAGEFAICGSRGWTNPLDENFTEEDQKIYQREQGRIMASLAAAKQDGFSRMILMTHYPLFYAGYSCPWLEELTRLYPISHYVFGHLHGSGISLGLNGCYAGVDCRLVSCDALDFKVATLI